MKPVALVSMPTLGPQFPSFQLGLLKPTLERAGVPAESFSLFLHFAKKVGWELDYQLSMVDPSMVGEWIWSFAAFGDFADDAAYLRRFRPALARQKSAGGTPERLKKLKRHDAPRFVDWALGHTDWSRFSMVGFTVVFQQLLASIAFARRLKERWPKLPVVFGGATFEDDIAEQVMLHCPFVDAVHCGDADETFPELARRLDAGESLKGLKGVMHREGGQLAYAGRAPNLTDLDRTPVPDYDDYYALVDELGYHRWENARVVMVPIETARGCWYGMKNHCTFCGLNRSGMEFRHKSPPQVLEMLQALSRRYGATHFNAIDNILAPGYAEQLFGRLKEEKSDLKLHYEIRPNVSREKLKLMHEGGLDSVQPGVESFSTHVLTLMKKFTTGVRNLELLKWTTYYGIENLYNILYGFHGETAEDYAEQAQLMRKLPHVQAPWSMSLARPDRGSPMFERPQEHGIDRLTPAACYPYLFPPQFDLKRASYYFDDVRHGVPPPEAYQECLEVVDEWKRRWDSPRRPSLTYLKGFGTVSLSDRRGPKERLLRLDDRAARLYEALADARRREDLLAEFDGDGAWLDGMLAELEHEALAVHLDGRWLGLALPANPYH